MHTPNKLSWSNGGLNPLRKVTTDTLFLLLSLARKTSRIMHFFLSLSLSLHHFYWMIFPMRQTDIMESSEIIDSTENAVYF